jgi:uncharacterized alpha-E superfamily protein
MLSRTADHLYWMARYTERAENTARLLDVNYQMSLLPQSAETAAHGWQAMLDISELSPAFEAKYPLLSSKDVLNFMVCDLNNPSSIVSCLRAARENARAVRGSITTEVWETLNTTWLEVQKIIADGTLNKDPTRFFEWVKFRSHLSRGVESGTMLKDESFYFLRLGTFVERADNTARLLDVKFHGGDLHQDEFSHQHGDYYHWAAVLRSVSAFEVYRKTYRDVITPERVAELLILRSDMPRSLAASLEEVVTILKMVRNQQSSETERRAGKLYSELLYGRIDDVFGMGLHAYLTHFLERINDLANGISRDFLVPLAE